MYSWPSLCQLQQNPDNSSALPVHVASRIEQAKNGFNLVVKSLTTSLVDYMSSPDRLSSVGRISVTFVHRTQAIEIFGNVSTPFGNLAIRDLSIKILRRSSQGNPSVGG